MFGLRIEDLPEDKPMWTVPTPCLYGLTERQTRLLLQVAAHALNNEALFNGLVADGYDYDELEELKSVI